MQAILILRTVESDLAYGMAGDTPKVGGFDGYPSRPVEIVTWGKLDSLFISPFPAY